MADLAAALDRDTLDRDYSVPRGLLDPYQDQSQLKVSSRERVAETAKFVCEDSWR